MRDSRTMLTHVRVHGVLNMLMGLLSENIGVRETKEARGSKRSDPLATSTQAPTICMRI